VVVAFQPHRFTRTHALFEEFTRAFNRADVLFVTEVYPAGEAPIEGATGSALTRGIQKHGHHNANYVEDKKKVPSEIFRVIHPGDLVIFLGAGDINAGARELDAKLKAETGP
jgi:UDP-N-acetylmuramate--alanine ligase